MKLPEEVFFKGILLASTLLIPRLFKSRIGFPQEEG
jgi:hypothetical protein